MIEGISGRPVPPPVSGGGDTALHGRAAETRPAALAEAAQASGKRADAVVAAPSVDVDKVAALRAAIASGSYRIDPIAIAQRIVAADQPALTQQVATISG